MLRLITGLDQMKKNITVTIDTFVTLERKTHLKRVTLLFLNFVTCYNR